MKMQKIIICGLLLSPQFVNAMHKNRNSCCLNEAPTQLPIVVKNTKDLGICLLKIAGTCGLTCSIIAKKSFETCLTTLAPERDYVAFSKKIEHDLFKHNCPTAPLLPIHAPTQQAMGSEPDKQ